MSQETKTPLPSFAKRAEVSSQIASAVYKAEPKELRVVFKGSPEAVYAYLDVPPAIWAEMLVAPSLGSFVIQRLKRAGYAFEKRVGQEVIQAQTADFANLLDTLAANPLEAKATA